MHRAGHTRRAPLPQPDIGEWIRHQRTNVRDCQHFGPWRVNVFTDLGCTVGELVLHRQALPPSLLIASGVDFRTLRERHGLTPALMLMLKYSLDDWVKLRIEEDFLMSLSDEHWTKLFGLTRRSEVVAMVRHHNNKNKNKNNNLTNNSNSNKKNKTTTAR